MACSSGDSSGPSTATVDDADRDAMITWLRGHDEIDARQDYRDAVSLYVSRGCTEHGRMAEALEHLTGDFDEPPDLSLAQAWQQWLRAEQDFVDFNQEMCDEFGDSAPPDVEEKLRTEFFELDEKRRTAEYRYDDVFDDVLDELEIFLSDYTALDP